jgi:aspartate/methionine/tyrosine aminotransferase
MSTLLSPSSTVICLTPSYQSLHQIAETTGAKVIPWFPRVQSRVGQSSFAFGPDKSTDKSTDKTTDKTTYYDFVIEDLEAIVAKHEAVDMVVINFPHNPTGAMVTPGQLSKIVSIAKSKNAYIFSDEMYKYLEHEGRETLPSVCTLYDKGISLGGVSKSMGLPGLRIGWLATRDDDAMEAMSNLKDYTTISSSRPSEVLAQIALQNRSVIVDHLRQMVLENKSYLKSFVQGCDHLRWIEPEGGTFAFVELTNGQSADEYTTMLKEKGGLALMSGSLFVKGDEKCLRVCFGRKDLVANVSIWQEIVAK